MLLGLGKFQQVQYECNALPTTPASRKERENSMQAPSFHRAGYGITVRMLGTVTLSYPARCKPNALCRLYTISCRRTRRAASTCSLTRHEAITFYE